MKKFLNSLVFLSVTAMAVPANAATPRTIAAIPNEHDAPILLMVDLGSGQTLYARDADRRFVPASITKVMTTFLAFEWMEEGRLFPQQVFAMRPETFAQWHRVGSTMFLPNNAQVSVDDLVHGITTVSANDGSVVLAEGAAGSVADWTAAMNAKSAELGMRNSHWNTPNGWMDDGQTFTTARDLSILGQTMLSRHPTKYKHFFGARTFVYNGITQSNHDPISGVVPGADGIKTGFTNQAGYGFLGSAIRDGRRLVMVVAGSPNGRARGNAARAFIEWGFDSFDSKPMFNRGAEVATARVQGGNAISVGLRARGPINVSVPRGTNPKMKMSVRYEGPLQAPIAAGEEVAQLVVNIDGMPEHRIPLVAAQSVEKAGLVGRIVNGVVGWVR